MASNLRSILAVVLGLAFSLSGAAQDSRERSEEAIRSGQQLAARMAAKKVVSDLSTLELSGLGRTWAAQILREPGRHARATASRQILAAEYEQRLRRTLRERLRKVHAGFNPGGRDRWFAEAWLLQQVEAGMKDQVEQGIARNARTRFAGLFQSSRQLATREQLRRISGVAYPEVQEVEELARAGWQPAAQERLAQALVARMSRQATLLEETARSLQQSATGAIQDARTQLESQSEALTRPVPDGARTTGDIARALRAAVEQVRQQWQSAGRTSHLYGVFPMVQSRLAQRALALEKEKFQEFCKRFPVDVSEARLRKMIEGNLRGHQNPVESRTLALKALLPEIAARARERYAAGVEGPQRAAFQTRLRDLAQTDPALREALRANLDTALTLPLKRVRDAIAETQFKDHFPRIVSGQWRAPEEAVKRYNPKQEKDLPYDQCLLLEGVVQGDPPDSSMLLEETRSKAAHSTTALLAEGRAAWDAQGSIVSDIKVQIPLEIQAGPEKHSVKEWQRLFIDRAVKLWSDRPDSPVGKYPRLFFEREKDIRAYVQLQYKVAQSPPIQDPGRKEHGPSPGPSPPVQEASDGKGFHLGDFLLGLIRGLLGPGGGGKGGGTGGGIGNGLGPEAGGGAEGGAGTPCPEKDHRLLILLLLLLAIALTVVLIRSARREDLWWAVPAFVGLLVSIAIVA